MYRDPKQWAYIRRLILEKGASRRGIARKTGLSRKTVRKMLASPRPPNKASAQSGAEEKLLEAACSLAGRRPSIEPSAYRRRALYFVESRTRPRLEAGPATRSRFASRDGGSDQRTC